MKLVIVYRGHCRRKRKKFGKFRPLMCKNSENVAKLSTSRKSPGATHAGVRNGLLFDFARSPKLWPVVRQRHGPIARGPGAWPTAFDAPNFYNLHIVNVKTFYHKSVCHKIEGVQLRFVQIQHLNAIQQNMHTFIFYQV